jgi:hypothetical protein
MVARAGGEPVLGHKGGHAEVTMWDAVRGEAPTIVVVAPCGYHLAEATEQARAVLAEVATTPAGRNKEVWAIDADAEVVRPGPRLVDGLELLAWLIAGGRGTRLTRTRSPASADADKPALVGDGRVRARCSPTRPARDRAPVGHAYR